jgi:site-specific DNA-methyltransferase (adenine-specific)
VKPIVVRGDARRLPLPDSSVDAVVTDPPYELGFMGRSWDRSGVAFQPDTWAEVLRVAKPGAYLLAFGGTRTYHRLTCAVEDAGWIVEDSIGVLGWVHAQGFPKGKNKLKPAWEPVVLARKAGPSVLGVDACRVPSTDKARFPVGYSTPNRITYAQDAYTKARTGGPDPDPAGRWPTNLVLVHHPDCTEVGTTTVRGDGHHPARRGAGGLSTSGHAGQDGLAERYAGDEVVPVMECVPGCPVAELDGQSGIRAGGHFPEQRTPNAIYGGGKGTSLAVKDGPRAMGDSGGASRFYPVFRFNPKADGWERPEVVLADGTVLQHPTVKPVDLMRWLVRMVTPPGGLVLDPFAGSGATLQAAQVEGFRSVGVELDAGHCSLIRERLSWPVRVDEDDRFVRSKPHKDPDQWDLMSLDAEDVG